MLNNAIPCSISNENHVFLGGLMVHGARPCLINEESRALSEGSTNRHFRNN